MKEVYNSLNTRLRKWFMHLMMTAMVLIAGVSGAWAQGYTEIGPAAAGPMGPLGGTVLGLADDDFSVAVPLGFSLNYYGQTYSSAHVSSNGFITFDNYVVTFPAPPSVASMPGNLPLPNPLGTNMIAGYWADLLPGTVSYTTVGVTPAQTFIVQWFGALEKSSGVLFNIEIRIAETTGVITFHVEKIIPLPSGLAVQGTNNYNGVYGDGIPARMFPSVFYPAFAPASDLVTMTPACGVLDAVAPIINGCPSNITVSVPYPPMVCAEIVSWTPPTATDNCPGVILSQTAGGVPTTLFPVGSTWIQYTAVDANGNTATCGFYVTVLDTVRPVITGCPSNITINNDPGMCTGSTALWTAPTSSDNCAITSWTNNYNSGDFFPIGTTLVWYLASDSTGNTTSCSFNVTVLDVEVPIITSCPASVTVNNDLGMCNAAVTLSTLTWTDNCPATVTVTNDYNAGGADASDTYPVGTTTVIFTVNDGSNSTTCSMTVTVVDVDLPTITCPANITVSNDLGLCSAVVTYTILYSDNCSVGISLVSGIASGSAFPVGTTTNIWMATDASGNTATCSFTVTVNDTEIPTITCPGNVVVGNDAGLCSAVVTYATPSTTDNCPGETASLVSGLGSGGTFAVGGPYTEIWMVTDASGNTATCSFTITVNDTEFPVFTACPSNVTVSNDIGTCAAIVTWNAPGGTDNCAVTGGPTQYTGPASGSSFVVGSTTTIGYWISDAAGNTTSCSWTIHVDDNEDPTITCPASVTVNNDIGFCSAVVTYAAPTTTDNCPGETFVQTSGLISGAAFPVGVTTNVFVVTDAEGNTASCSFTVTVNDTELPVIVCTDGSEVTSADGTGDCAYNTSFGIGGTGFFTISDNCPFGASNIVTEFYLDGVYQSTSFNTLAAGAYYYAPFSYTVGVWRHDITVTDASGNTSSCSYTNTITDDEAPTITCPANITVSHDPGVCTGIAGWPPIVTADNCPGEILSQVSGLASGSAFPMGVTTNVFMVTDAAGNTTTCSFTVTVIDDVGPALNCPSNIVMPVLNDSVCFNVVTWIFPTAFDCSNPVSILQTAGPAPPAVFPVGVTTIAYTATDFLGNTSTCGFTVTIYDSFPPIQNNCPADIVVYYDTALCGQIVTWTPPIAWDNCAGVTNVTNHVPGETFPVGVTTVVYVATDPTGLTDTCTFTVTVLDTVAPTIVCPPSVTVSNDVGLCSAVVTYTLPVISDDCPGIGGTQCDDFNSGIGSLWSTTNGIANTNCGSVSGLALWHGDAGTRQSTTVALNTTYGGTVDYWMHFPASGGFPCEDADGGEDVVLEYSTNGGGSWTTMYNNPPGAYSVWTFISAPIPVGAQTSSTIFRWRQLSHSGPSFDHWSLDDVCINGSVGGAGGLVLTQLSGLASGSAFPVGTTTNVFMVTDISGNTATCSFDVTVNDTENPVIICPATITTGNDAGACSAVVTYSISTSDNCPGETWVQTAGIASGGTFPVGTTNNVFVVTDAAGNTAGCSFVVQVLDTENPVVVCPNNLTVNSAIGVCGNTIIGLQPISLTDNCPGVTVTNNINGTADASNFYPVGVTSVVYTATDASGNTSSCGFTVTVIDIEPPVVTCPADITVNNDIGFCSAIVTYTVLYTDNCSGLASGTAFGWTGGSSFDVSTQSFPTITNVDYLSFTSNHYVEGHSHGGPVTMFIELWDVNASAWVTVWSMNLTGGASFDFNGLSITFPSMDISQIRINSSPSQNQTYHDWYAPVSMLFTSSYPTITQTAGLASGSAFPVGTTTNTFIVTDEEGNTATCSFNVTVVDAEAPIITCPGSGGIPFASSYGGGPVAIPDNSFPGVSVSHSVSGIPGTALGTDVQLDSVAFNISHTWIGDLVVILVSPSGDTVQLAQRPGLGTYFGCCGCSANDIIATVTTGTGSDMESVCGSSPGISGTYTAHGGVDLNLLNNGINPNGTWSLLVRDLAGADLGTVNGFTLYFSQPGVGGGVITTSTDPGVCSAVVTYTVGYSDNCPGVSLAQTSGIASGGIFPKGLTTNTFVATDAAGNTSSCSFVVEVIDTEAPTIACPGNITVNNDPGLCSAVVTFNITTTDNCPGEWFWQTAGLASGSAFPFGTTYMEYYVRDTAGNTASCSFTITVFDNEVPQIFCVNQTFFNDPGKCYTSQPYVAPNVFDNCPGEFLTHLFGPMSGDTLPVGVHTVGYMVTDHVGLTASCQFTVTVIDNEPPTTTCPASMAVPNDLGICGAVVTFLPPAPADNCPGATVVQVSGLGFASGSTFPVGATLMEYVITDNAGLSILCSFTITVYDNEDPIIINCPVNITVNNDAGQCGANVTWTAPTATDNCGVTSLTPNIASGSFFPVGTTTVVYTALDAAGNSTTCSFDVTVIDNELPVIVCPGNVVVGNDPGDCSALVAYSNPITSDNCPGETWIQTSGLASGSSFPVGVTTNVFVVTDASGNTASCSMTVTVLDTEVPVITCYANIQVNNDPGICGAVISYQIPTATDNCPGVSVALSSGMASGSTFPVGTTTVVYTATDVAGNTATCSFLVTVLDVTPPTISCPANMTVGNTPGMCGAVVSYVVANADNCPGQTLILTHGLGSGATFPLGTTLERYLVIDASGNIATCGFTITVNDTEAPQISCPANITVNNDAGFCGAIVTYNTPVGTDNCPNAVTVLTAGFNSGSFFALGTTTVSYLVTDAVGMTASCSFTITVVDNENPTVTCPANIVVSNDAGLCSAVVTWAMPTYADNCGVVSVIGTHTSGAVFPVGTTTVSYIVADAAGNTATCSFNITVNDTELPQITCPQNVIITNDAGLCSAVYQYAAPVGTDNCPGAITVQTAGLVSGSAFPVGVTTNTFVVTDASGNSVACSFTVTVLDTELPTIACPSNIVVGNDVGFCSAVVSYSISTTDNCPGETWVQTGGIAAGGIFPVGITTNTFVVTDASGNSAACSFTVTVLDTENPVIAGCPANIVVGNDQGVCGAVVSWVAPTATDNCPGVAISQTSGLASSSTFPVGTSTVIYTAVDAAGNAVNCVFTVTVLDVEAPQIVCTSNITVSNDIGFCDAYVTIPVPVHSDNCPGVSIVNSYNGTGNATDTYPVGTTSVTWTVTDVAGNSTTCSFEVTVNDTENPQITCPGNITVNNDIGICGAVVTYVPPVGTDNCGLTTTSVFLTHSLSQAITPGSVSCNYAGGVHAQNSYLRVFDLNTFGVPGFTVSSIDMGIESAFDGTGSQPATVNLYSLSGALNYANMTLLATQAITVANQTSTILNVPISANVPAGTQLVLEFMVPDALAAGSQFFAGSNASGQTGPSYLAAPACGITQPLDLTLIGFPNMMLVMNVNGSYTTGAPPLTSLASGMGSGGTFPVGTSTEVWMVVDASGNSTTCSFEITVIDNEAPVITNCPSSITLGNDAGNCSAVALWGAPTVTDNCAVDTVFSSHASGDAFPVGTTSVVYTAIDIYGNSATCGFDITVLDIEKPVIVNCPANISTCDPIVFWTAPTASDNCGVTSFTSTHTSGATYPVGITTVTYTATDAAGNVQTCTFTITIHPLPVADAGADQTICFGTSTTIGGFPTGNAGTPPYTYSWSPAAGLSSTTVANPTASPAATTTYTVTVTDINGCTDTDEVTVTVNPLPTVSAGSNTAICIGTSTTIGGSPTASGTVAPYTYAWTPTTGLTNPASANPVATPTVTTTYTVTVTDANGCINTASVTVTVNPLPNATITPAGPFCLNDPATNLTAATAGGTWAGVGITNAVAGTFNPAVAGVGTHTITYTVTDANGCTNSASTIITVYGLPGANVLPAGPYCVNGSQVYLTGVPTINPHVWAGPGIVNTANGLFDPSVAGVGTHTVSYTVTNANGCTQTATTSIVVNAAPNANITAAGPFCEDEPALNLTAATAGGTWSGPGITHAQLGTFYPYAAGAGVHTINYIVTNANGCTSIGATTIVVNELPEVTALVTDVNCVGGNDGALDITVSGGLAPYTYLWSTGAATEDISGLMAGNYTVTVTDQNGCQGVASFTVGTKSSVITATAIITAATTPQHANGAIDLTVSGGTLPYSFAWSNGAGTEDITGLTSGTYDVTITDANGCSYIFSYVVPSRFGTGIDPNDLSKHILLYPNPTSDVINIEIEATGIDSDMYITIYDVLGRKVYERADHMNNKYTLQVSMRNWAAGHYMIMFNIGDEVVTKKVILTE